MLKQKLSPSLEISKVIHGFWRLADWNISTSDLVKIIEYDLSLGINTFDHADIYGGYQCEKLFGLALKNNIIARSEINLISKCGIKLISDSFPQTYAKHYDYSFEHIIESVNRSLENLHTDYLDLLLLHRPSPLMHYQEIARAFDKLKNQGKVNNFGVSNFSQTQFEALNSTIDETLVTNQIEFSPFQHEHILSGNLDYLQGNGIRPMAWSPLAENKYLDPSDEVESRITNVLKDIQKKYEYEHIEEVIYTWILQHPANFSIITGTSQLSRVSILEQSLRHEMDIQDWFLIFNAYYGKEVP